jgi:alanine dehydrogenase
MPGAVPHTSTYALTNATLPYVVDVANRATAAAFEDAALRGGLTTVAGRVTNQAVADALDHPFAADPFAELA